jgi:hypothetical protein
MNEMIIEGVSQPGPFQHPLFLCQKRGDSGVTVCNQKGREEKGELAHMLNYHHHHIISHYRDTEQGLAGH